MKTNKLLASIVLGLSFPALYLLWVQNMKNTWIENDILKTHPDILFPDNQRFKRIDPTKEFQEALILEVNVDKEIKK